MIGFGNTIGNFMDSESPNSKVDVSIFEFKHGKFNCLDFGR